MTINEYDVSKISQHLDELVPDNATGILKMLLPKLIEKRDQGIRLIDMHNALVAAGLKLEYATFKNLFARLVKKANEENIRPKLNQAITLSDIHMALVNAGFDMDYSAFENKIATIFPKHGKAPEMEATKKIAAPAEPINSTSETKPSLNDDKPISPSEVLSDLDQSDDGLEQYRRKPKRPIK